MVRVILLLLIVGTPIFGQGRDTLSIELVLDDPDAQPFESEMILATLRGVYRETITNEDLKLRRMTDFDWMQLGEDQWSQQYIDGRSARVMERRIALFPKWAGELEILPIAHDLEILDAEGQRMHVLVRSKPVVITVRPKPAGAGDNWLPVRGFEISDSWSEDTGKLSDGESAQRRIILRVLGQPPELLPQQPAMRAPWLITFTPPEDRSLQLTPQGPVSTVVWTWTLRPITGEPGVLPEVVIPYYDTAKSRFETAVIAPASIGYESFNDNAPSGWQSDILPGSGNIVMFVAGMLAALSLVARRRQLRAGAMSAIRRRIGTWRSQRQLCKLADTGDLEGFRRLASDVLSKQTTIRQDEMLKMLRPLDSNLFGNRADVNKATLQQVCAKVTSEL